jgi:hypothetical protein
MLVKKNFNLLIIQQSKKNEKINFNNFRIYKYFIQKLNETFNENI